MSIQSATRATEPVAIVGIAAELPSGHYSERNLDHTSFFDFLLSGGQAYEKIPLERFNIDSWKGAGLGQIVTESGAFLKNIALFDHVEFGISSKDARSMSVSTRKLIELSFLALLDSGINYRGRRVGCYTSGIPFDILTIADPDEFEARGSFAGGPCMIANKVSYHLDLLGPSIPTDTACSSSLTALHLAVQALRSGDCEAAVVGGCQLNHRFVDFIQYSQGGVLSPDGRCKPFDASANGFARGEGAVVIIVKLLNDAIRDGDHIYASVLGTAVNASGSAAPANAPVGDAQIDVMELAYRQAGRDPSEVDFIELHATGTAAGDPVEANWVGHRFKKNEELLIGSVKGNIGHLEIAAFLASLSKICSMFSHGIIPPNVNLHNLNPAIHWKDLRLRVPIEPTPLIASKLPLVSMMSSGIGGTNGHAVLEGPPPKQKPEDTVHRAMGRPVLLTAGGLSPRSSSAIVESLIEKVSNQDIDLTSISTVCGRRSRQVTWRTFSVVLPDRSFAIPFQQPSFTPRSKPPLVFVFSGQGPQHIEMGRQLFKTYGKFRDCIMRLDSVYRNRTGQSLLEETGLFTGGDTRLPVDEPWPIAIIIPALAMVQIALYDLLQSVGIIPDMVIGHSAGETALLYASGAADAEMAMELAIARGSALSVAEATRSRASMAALSCTVVDAKAIILSVTREGDGSGTLEIACYNAPDAITLAGHETLIDSAVAMARKSGYFARKLHTRVAVHSSLMDVCQVAYKNSVSDVFSRYPGTHRPQIPTYSTLSGDVFSDSFTEEYFWDQTRHPVRFADAVSAILRKAPSATWLEISPHAALASYLATMGAIPSTILCPMRRVKNPSAHHEVQTYLQAVGYLVVLGYNFVNFCSLNEQMFVDHNLSLEPYPFARKQVPYYPESSRMIIKQLSSRNGPLNHADLRLNAQTHPTIAHHIIRGEPIMPAAGYLEMVFEFGARFLWDVSFRSMLSLHPDRLTQVDVIAEGCNWSVRSRSPNHSHLTQSRNTRLHADGYMSMKAPNTEMFVDLDLDAIRGRCQPFPVSRFYETLKYFAQYGPTFQRIIACWKGKDEAFVQLRGRDSDLPDVNDYVIHPAVLDACLHVMVHPSFTGNADRNTYYLPSRVESVIVHDICSKDAEFPDVVYTHAIFRSWSPEGIIFDCAVSNSQGNRLCTMNGFEIAAHQNGPPATEKNSYDLIYQAFSTGPFFIAETNEDVAESTDCKDTHVMTTPSSRFYSVNNGLQYESIVDITDEVGESNYHLRDADVLPSSILLESISIIQRFLAHVKDTVGKRVIRILDLGTNSEFTRSLDDMLFNQESSFIFVHDVSRISNDSSPNRQHESTRLIDYDMNHDPEDQGISNATFDAIVGFDILESVQDLSKTISSFHRMLFPGGALILGQITAQPVYHFLPSGIAPSSAASVSEWQTLRNLVRNTGFSWMLLPDANSGATTPLLGAQKESLSLSTAASTAPDSSYLIAEFHLGKEMQVRQSIDELDEDAILWILATNDINGAAARGFSRSLRKELLSRQLRLVLFDEIWNSNDRLRIIQQLSRAVNVEEEILVDSSGSVLVPRLVPTPLLPEASSQLIPSDYWVQTKSGVVSPSAPHVSNHQVFVRVTLCSELVPGELFVISGDIERCATATWKKGTHVIGVSAQGLSNYCLAHEGQLACTGPNVDERSLLAMLGGILVANEAIGLQSLSQLHRLDGRRILVTNRDTPIGQGLIEFLTGLGLQLETTSSALSVNDFSRVSGCDLVISGFTGADRCMLQSITKHARSFYWNDDSTGISKILSANPWVIQDTIPILRKRFAHVVNASSAPRVFPPDHFLPAEPKIIRSSLFNPYKVYLLIGGIGSLGIHIALWMYEKGARIIVLTSRSGRQSLIRENNVIALRILGYLEKRSDLRLMLEKCDASSVFATKALVSSIQPPIGGAMLLSVVLSDRVFASHTEDTYYAPFPPKQGAFHAIQESLRIDELEFLITFSSATIFGNAGQTNYASANSVVDELTRTRTNAFSLVAPAIIDSSTIAKTEDLLTDIRLAHWAPWSMSSRQICDCIENGLRLLKQGPIWLYIPEYDWYHMHKHFGSSPIYNHLVPTRIDKMVSSSDDSISLEGLVIKFLDVSENDFDSSVPFTSYGLDSLSAGRLSFALKPFLSITQLQLLGDMSLEDVYARIGQQRDADLSAESPQVLVHDLTNGSLVRLIDGTGIPLILLHGLGGDVEAFSHLAGRFATPLWAIRVTSGPSMSSISNLANYYASIIRLELPASPYRLGAFSGTSLLVCAVARLLESSGDRIVQLAMLDDCPALFTISPLHLMLGDSPDTELVRAAARLFVDYKEGDTSSSQHHITEIRDVVNGLPVKGPAAELDTTLIKLLGITADFLLDLTQKSESHNVISSLVEWLSAIKAPITVYVALRGIFVSLGKEEKGWDDLGSHICFPLSKVFKLDAGHYSLLQDPEVARSLQKDWNF